MVPEVVRLQGREILGIGERARALGTGGHRSSAVGGEAVEQMDPHSERELLAGDAVDQCLEDGRKARGLEPPQTGGERAEQRVRRGHGGERREVDAQPEEPVERAARERLRGLIDAPAGEHDRQARRVWPSHLRHRQRDRRAVERHHALIRVRVPAIDRIVGAPAQRPGRQVEAKRSARVDLELATR